MLKAYWYIACQSHQLSKKPIHRKILGESLAFFRNAQGEAGAVADACPHRGMSLSRGKCTKSGLQCKYHGWTFNTQGHCSDLPALIHPAQSGLKTKSYPVLEQQGFVWVYMGSETPACKPYEFPHYGEDHWETWTMERIFPGNAFHCCENFLDVPHTVYVHSGWFRNERRNPIEFEVRQGENWVEAEFLNEKPMDSLLGKLIMPSGVSPQHTDRFILPYTTRVDYIYGPEQHFLVSSQCTPIDENTTRTFTYMAHRLKYWGKVIKPLYKIMSHVILNQDVKIISEQTASHQSHGKSPFLYHKTDAIALEMNRLIQGKTLENLPRRGEILI